MTLRHARALQIFGTPWKHCLPYHTQGLLISAFAKSLCFPNSKLQDYRFVLKRLSASSTWNHTCYPPQSVRKYSTHWGEAEEALGSSTLERVATNNSISFRKIVSYSEFINHELYQDLKKTLHPKKTTHQSRPSLAKVARYRNVGTSQISEPTKSVYALGQAPVREQPCEFISLAIGKPTDETNLEHDHLEQRTLRPSKWIRRLAQLRREEEVDDPRVRVLSKSGLLKQDNDRFLALWKQVASKFARAERKDLWQSMLLLTLQNDHDKAFALLEATIIEASCELEAPNYAIADALKFLVSRHLEGQVTTIETRDKLLQLACSFPWAIEAKDRASQKMLYWLLRHSDNHQVRNLYMSLESSRVSIHPMSLTHFLNRFTQMGNLDLAIDALRRIAVFKAYISSDVVQYSCITLLRMRFNEAERYRVQSNLMTEMLELGIRPGMPMLNAMILNAVEASDYETAHAIFETARRNGIRPDTISYSTLLKIARQSLDQRLVGTIMQMAEKDGALPKNNTLLFCLVITSFQIALAENKDANLWALSYRTMLEIYARYCDTRPLEDLGIDLHVGKKVEAPGEVFEPSSLLLSAMILGYIRLFGQPSEVKRLYFRYQEFVARDHHLVAPTAEYVHLANAFLFKLGENISTLKMIPIILSDMLNPPISTTIQIATPTVQTWSIVLRSYLFNNERAAGEKIIQMMREKGIQPGQVTMNTIISGYATMQDAIAAVNALQEMEAAGFQADSYTFKALTRITDRAQLLDALHKVVTKPVRTQKFMQSTENSSQFESEASVGSSKISAVSGDITVNTPRAVEGSLYSPPREFTRQSSQIKADEASQVPGKGPSRNGDLQQVTNQEDNEHPQKDQNKSRIPASLPPNLGDQDLSYLYEIQDGTLEAV